jgi:hypothetical protein
MGLMKAIADLLPSPDPGADPPPPPPPPDPIWDPTIEEINDYISRRGWPRLGEISIRHLGEDREAAQKLLHAVGTASQVIRDLRDGRRGMALILYAYPVDAESARTGYGCGKSHIAESIHRANAIVQYSPGYPDSLNLRPRGSFYDARTLMGLFDGEEFNRDIGREGNLQWEKRDPEIQLQEKRHRYFSILDYCQTRGINLVITTNLRPPELGNYLGGAAWSRIQQMCPKPNRINMTGIPDIRGMLGESNAVMIDEDWD